MSAFSPPLVPTTVILPFLFTVLCCDFIPHFDFPPTPDLCRHLSATYIASSSSPPRAFCLPPSCSPCSPFSCASSCVPPSILLLLGHESPSSTAASSLPGSCLSLSSPSVHPCISHPLPSPHASSATSFSSTPHRHHRISSSSSVRPHGHFSSAHRQRHSGAGRLLLPPPPPLAGRLLDSLIRAAWVHISRDKSSLFLCVALFRMLDR